MRITPLTPINRVSWKSAVSPDLIRFFGLRLTIRSESDYIPAITKKDLRVGVSILTFLRPDAGPDKGKISGA